MNPLKEFVMTKLKTEQVVMVSDRLVALFSVYVTVRLLLGKEIHGLPPSFVLKHCVVFALISFALFSWIRQDQGVLRSLTLDKASGIVGFAVLANLLYHPLMLLMGPLPPLTPVLNTLLFLAGLFLPRLLAPFWKREKVQTAPVKGPSKIPVLVVGYEEQVGAYLQMREKDDGFPYEPLGILLSVPLKEDNPAPPYPVMGTVPDFWAGLQKLAAQGCEPKRLLVTQEALAHLPLRQGLLKLQERGISSLCLEGCPASQGLILRPLHMEDFLGKIQGEPSSDSLWQEVRKLIDASRVLITGVQDAVLFQIAHHIAGFYPRQLIIIDPSERALAALKAKFDHRYPDVACAYVLASVTDSGLMEKIVNAHQPHIVIHGEAITDPALLESNLETAVQKTIFGTLQMAEAAQKTGASLFVSVAAQATTRPAQMIDALVSQRLQALDQAASKKLPTRFLRMRRGDVWSTLDSPTALWAERLSQGAPITLPAPDAYSYLLAPSEAARLILQASAKAVKEEKTKGQAFYLSGAEPARFLDLVHALASLQGVSAESEGKIHFSGKPFSVSSLASEETVQGFVPGVRVVAEDPAASSGDASLFAKLTGLVEKRQISKIGGVVGNS